MTQKEIIKKIKEIKINLRGNFSDKLLIELYKMIDMLDTNKANND